MQRTGGGRRRHTITTVSSNVARNDIWPGGKRFAFTIFDDTDLATLQNVQGVYSFLADCGFRTTKSVWAVSGDPGRGRCIGQTCDDPDYLHWVLELQSKGFEIAFHNGTWHGLPRDEIRAALERFAALFGHDPWTAANHTSVEDSIYWGDARLTGWRKHAYNVLTRFRNRGKFRGHVEGDAHFWGDLCRQKIKYYRNFTFRDINTLKACPFMPYHDPLKPYVNNWFASSEGPNVKAFTRCLGESNQDRLEEQGSACIMYAHLANGFCRDGQVDARFQQLMTRLSRKSGWFVPAATLLDHLLRVNGHHEITNIERGRLERKWLCERVFSGTT
jgi:hypothetical protein